MQAGLSILYSLMLDRTDNAAAAGAGVVRVVQQVLDHGASQGAEAKAVRLLACKVLYHLTTSPACATKALKFGIIPVLRQQLGSAAPAADEASLHCKTLTSLVHHGDSAVRPLAFSGNETATPCTRPAVDRGTTPDFRH